MVSSTRMVKHTADEQRVMALFESKSLALPIVSQDGWTRRRGQHTITQRKTSSHIPVFERWHCDKNCTINESDFGCSITWLHLSVVAIGTNTGDGSLSGVECPILPVRVLRSTGLQMPYNKTLRYGNHQRSTPSSQLLQVCQLSLHTPLSCPQFPITVILSGVTLQQAQDRM